MMRSVAALSFFKNDQENQDRIKRRKEHLRALQDAQNPDNSNNFCTLTDINPSTPCTSFYFDPDYKKSLLNDLANYHSIHELDKKLNLDKNIIDSELQRLYTYINSEAQPDPAIQADTLYSYIKLIQRKLTLIEFYCCFYPTEKFRKSLNINLTELKNGIQKSVTSSLTKLTEALHTQQSFSYETRNDSFSRLNDRLIFSILATLRHSLILTQPEFNAWLTTQFGLYANSLHSAYLLAYKNTPCFDSQYSSQLACERFQLLRTLTNKDQYAKILDTKFRFASNGMWFDMYIDLATNALQNKSGLYYFAKSLSRHSKANHSNQSRLSRILDTAATCQRYP